MTERGPSQGMARRQFEDGPWYWAPKVVTQEFTRKIGFLASAVYHLLASMVDEDQACFPSQKFIAERLGCARTSVTKAVKVLESEGLIRVTAKNGSNRYELLRVPGSAGKPAVSPEGTSDVSRGDTNDIQRKRNNNDTSGRVLRKSRKSPLKGFEPRTREELLAQDLALALNEPDEIPLYLSLAKNHPESFLRAMLSEVDRTPRHRIKKSRGALFTYLVKRYGS